MNDGSVSYDAAGNVIGDQNNTYHYDSQSQLTSTLNRQTGVLTCYFYDAEGRRVQKVSAATSCGYPISGGSSLYYLYDVKGNVITEASAPSGGTGAWTRQEVYANGRHLATFSASAGQAYWDFSDWLGSERVRVSALTGLGCESLSSLPWGDNLTQSGSCGDPSPLHFTGKQRDTESGLDYFSARYRSPILGRFLTPDPASFEAIDESPQNLNMYPYVLNNPLNATDPDGLDCIYVTAVAVGIERGTCSKDGGTYVDGTIDENSLTYNPATNELGFTFTNADNQTGGAGVIAYSPSPTASTSPSSNPGELNPFAEGVISQINRMPIKTAIAVVYGAGVVVGATAGAACYYFCGESEVFTLGVEGAGDVVTPSPGNVAAIERTAAQGGRKAVERALRTLQNRLAEHLAKLPELKGDPGSVEREIRNFRGLIKAAQDWLANNP